MIPTREQIEAVLLSIPKACPCGQSSCNWVKKHRKIVHFALKFTAIALDDPSEVVIEAYQNMHPNALVSRDETIRTWEMMISQIAKEAQ